MAKEKEIAPYDSPQARNQASDDLVRATVLTVNDEESWIKAREIRRRNKLLDKTAESHYRRVKEPQLTAIKAIRDIENQDREPMEKVIELLDPKILYFEDENERQRSELQRKLYEQAKADAEAQRGAKVEHLKSLGNIQAANELAMQPLFVPPVILPSGINFLDGEGRNETWKVVEVDVKQLIQAVVDGRVPESCIAPNMEVLNGMAKTLKETFAIPGCKARPEKGITQR